MLDGGGKLMTSDSRSAALGRYSVWAIDRIKDHAWKIGSGITPSGGAASYLESGVPLLRSQNVHFDGLRLDDVAFIGEDTHAEMAGTRLRPGDVLLNITGASIGRCTFVPEGFGEGNVDQLRLHHPAVLQNRLPLPNLLPIRPLGAGSGILQFHGRISPGSGRRDLGEIQVPVPPLPEQERIVAYLDASCAAIDAAVAAKRRQIETLESLAGSVINKAVIGGYEEHISLSCNGISWFPRNSRHMAGCSVSKVCSG